MQSSVMSSKGQIIIPKALRETRHWHAGTRLAVLETTDGILLKSALGDEKTTDERTGSHPQTHCIFRPGCRY